MPTGSCAAASPALAYRVTSSVDRVACADETRSLRSLDGIDDGFPNQSRRIIDIEQLAHMKFLSCGRRPRHKGRANEDRDGHQPALQKIARSHCVRSSPTIYLACATACQPVRPWPILELTAQIFVAVLGCSSYTFAEAT